MGAVATNTPTHSSLDDAAAGCIDLPGRLAVLEYNTVFYCRVDDQAGNTPTSFSGAKLYVYAESCAWP